MVSSVACPAGHAGPWRYVEAIEVWREVIELHADLVTVNSRWHTGEGYNDGVEGSAYLLCWADLGGGYCAERVELPQDLEVEWD